MACKKNKKRLIFLTTISESPPKTCSETMETKGAPVVIDQIAVGDFTEETVTDCLTFITFLSKIK